MCSSCRRSVLMPPAKRICRPNQFSCHCGHTHSRTRHSSAVDWCYKQNQCAHPVLCQLLYKLSSIEGKLAVRLPVVVHCLRCHCGSSHLCYYQLDFSPLPPRFSLSSRSLHSLTLSAASTGYMRNEL